MPLTAASLFAKTQGQECCGNWFCHWCGSPCSNQVVHDDPPPIPFVRSYSSAKRPAEPYVCVGCQLWRRDKNTINFLAGKHLEEDGKKWREGFRDGQAHKNYSWLITDRVALAIESKKDLEEVWRFLIAPTKRFVLMFRDPKDKMDNLIQLAVANDPGGILANTPLHFTLNNVPFEFSLYEVIESMRNRKGPTGPGLNALWAFLGSPPEDVRKQYPSRNAEPRGRGRPVTDEDFLEKVCEVVVSSGASR